MSTAYSSAKQQYIGNGVTTEWGFDFPIKKHSELKVYLKRSGSTQVLLEEGVDYSFVTENTIAFPIKTGEAKLQAADVLALQRESVFESEYNFSNQQRLEPEEVMHADDNLERQIQELKRDVTQAIRIQPTSNINTDEYFIAVESIYENLDNITNVSGISAEIVNCSDNIEAIQDAPNQANAASQSASAASQSASAASQSASDASQSATNAASSATDSANSATASATSAQAAQDALNEVHGLIATPIGTIFQSVYVDESLDIARQLNGQLISSTKFTGFRSWLNTVQTAIPNLFTTETNWQAEKTNSKLGQCGKFVIDDTAQTIRLPAVVNAQGLLGLSGIGNLVNESLPNITGSIYSNMLEGSMSWTGSGCLYGTQTVSNNKYTTGGTTNNTPDTINIDASRSSSTYQNNAPVQQEAVQYPYYIQVATGVEETLPSIREYKINTPFFFGQSMYSDVAPDNASWLASNGQYNARTVYPDYYDWLLEKRNEGTKQLYGWATSSGTGICWTLSSAPQVGDIVYGYNNPIGKVGTITSVTSDTITFDYDFGDNSFVRIRNTKYDKQDFVYDIADINVVSKEEFDSWDYPNNTSDYDFVINTTDQTFRLPLLNGEEDLPSEQFETWTLGNSKQIYPITKNGFLCFRGVATATTDYSYISQCQEAGTIDVTRGILGLARGAGAGGNIQLYLSKGSYAYIEYEGWSEKLLTFNIAKGNGTLYYYVGDTVQDASLINAGAVLGQLSNKADIDASNFNADGKSLLSGLSCMSNGVLISKNFATGTKFTAPDNGWFKFRGMSTASPSRCFMANVSVQGVPAVGGDTPASEALNNIMLRVKKGDMVSFQYTNLNITYDEGSGAWFYPDVGEI